MKTVKLINHDYLPILMLLHIMLVYLMLLAALSNAVCLYNAFFLAIYFCKCFLLRVLSWFIDKYFFISSMIFHHAQCF